MLKNPKESKKKLDAYNKQMKKENSKEVYIRRVQAYKRRWKEQKENMEILLQPATT